MKKLILPLLALTLPLWAQLKIPNRTILEKELVKIHQQNDQFELDEIKITIPVDQSTTQENGECLFLVHADEMIKSPLDVTTKLNAILNDPKHCKIINDNLSKKPQEKWKFSFHFGFSRTNYQNTDMTLQSSRVNVVIKDFEFEERTSDDFYNPANWEQFQDAFRWIDEPTNHFIISAEKNNHTIILSIFHPKFLKKQYQEKYVTGTVDGVAVDGLMDINEEFDDYNNQLGEMFLVRFENTHLQMNWQLGYGYDIKILNSPKAGTLSLRPEVYIGLMSGRNLTVYTKPGEYWEFDDYVDRHQIQGMTYTAGLTVNYQLKNFNFFVNGKYSKTHLEHGFMDGTASYDLTYTPVTFGVGYTFDLSKKKKKKK